MNISGKKILVTGGRGFLGKALVPMLVKEGADVLVPSHEELDLTIWKDTIQYMERKRPDIVVHAAVDGGGIGYMKDHPGSVYYNNTLMNTFIVEASRLINVEKFLGVGTVCSYPKFTPVPFKEEDLWNGYPEETNAPYGLAKKMMLVQTQAYNEQYGFNGIHVLMINLYGPNDDFNLETGHVIPALIRKFSEAKKNDDSEVILWGTGTPTREFLYVEDAARGLVHSLKYLNDPDPVNLGSGQEISIKELSKLISDLVGFNGDIVWDGSRPDGQPKRKLDTSKMEELGFSPKYDLEEGLGRTIRWFEEEMRNF